MSMKTSLEHLNKSKRRDLEFIVRIIREQFDQVVNFATGKKKHGQIVAIILFGSTARGDWVKDEVNGYVSDYDVLVVVNRKELMEEYEIWSSAEDRIGLHVKTPFSLIVHTLNEVNLQLTQGSYFFGDIKREGIVLFGRGIDRLKEPGDLTREERKIIAQGHFEFWFDSARGFYRFYEVGIEEGNLNGAAIQLHQAAERYYHCLMLVYTNYKPKTHNLVRLNDLAVERDVRFTEIFPLDTKIHRRRFHLLKRAYVEARYSEHYKITEEELT